METRPEGLEQPGTGEGGLGCAGRVPPLCTEKLQLTMCVVTKTNKKITGTR